MAVPLSDALKAQLLAAEQDYPYGFLRWTREENLHLTLLFLGAVPEEQVPALKDRLKGFADALRPMALQGKHVTPGPKPRKPRLIWAEFHPTEMYTFAVLKLREMLADFTEKAEDRKPLPHVTLAKIRRGARLPDEMPVLPLSDLHLPIAEVQLWQSQLSQDGAVYQAIARYPLKA